MKRTHGETGTRLYRSWSHMKYRCLNPNCKHYKSYGGRGIKVCDEWVNSYEAFRNWALANGYKEDLTIERIDVNGNYEPSNCKWIPMRDQAKNKRGTVYVTCNGETKTLQEWSEQLGVSYYTLHKRIKYLGYTPEEVILKEVRHFDTFNTKFSFNGEEHTLGEWAKIMNITYDVLTHRIFELNQPLEKALTNRIKVHNHKNERFTLNGETMTLLEWSKKLNIPYDVVRKRIFTYKWDLKDALTKSYGERR